MYFLSVEPLKMQYTNDYEPGDYYLWQMRDYINEDLGEYIYLKRMKAVPEHHDTISMCIPMIDRL